MKDEKRFSKRQIIDESESTELATTLSGSCDEIHKALQLYETKQQEHAEEVTRLTVQLREVNDTAYRSVRELQTATHEVERLKKTEKYRNALVHVVEYRKTSGMPFQIVAILDTAKHADEFAKLRPVQFPAEYSISQRLVYDDVQVAAMEVYKA